MIKDDKTLTENTVSRSIVENKVRAMNPHTSVNQYHFDTNALNKYLTNICQYRGISFIDAEVIKVNLDSLLIF